MKKYDRKLRLNRETVLRLEQLPPRAAGAGQLPYQEKEITSPLCVSTCCGGCDTQLQ